MVVRRGVTLHVAEREPEMLPFVPRLLREWIGCGFEPLACRRALDGVLDDPGSGASELLLIRDGVTDGGMVAADELLYPVADRALRIQVFDAAGPPRSVTARFDESSASEVGNILRDLTRS